MGLDLTSPVLFLVLVVVPWLYIYPNVGFRLVLVPVLIPVWNHLCLGLSLYLDCKGTLMLGSDYMLMTGFDFFLPNTHYRQLSWNCAPSSALNLIHSLERVVWQINFLKVWVSDIYFMWEEKWVTTHVERIVVCHKFSYHLLLSNFLGFSINCMISDPYPPLPPHLSFMSSSFSLIEIRDKDLFKSDLLRRKILGVQCA
jgi:hypothetical protein